LYGPKSGSQGTVSASAVRLYRKSNVARVGKSRGGLLAYFNLIKTAINTMRIAVSCSALPRVGRNYAINPASKGETLPSDHSPSNQMFWYYSTPWTTTSGQYSKPLPSPRPVAVRAHRYHWKCLVQSGLVGSLAVAVPETSRCRRCSLKDRAQTSLSG
jgi:hypothetical protein